MLGNKLRQGQREKNKELSKIRNEMMILKSASASKSKPDYDESLKAQNDILKGN